MSDVRQVPEGVKSPWPPLAYPDVIQVWVRRPFNAAQVLALQRLCRGRKPYAEDGLAPFPGGWRQRVQLRQPTDPAIRYILQHNPDALVNSLELALDLNYPTPAEAQKAFTYLIERVRTKGRHLVQDLGNGQRRFYGGPRRASVVLKAYDNKPCRVNGHPHCLHLEWVARKRVAVERFGISSLQDILAFDHEAFWARKLVLQEVDLGKLGRMWDNHAQDRWRRSSYRTEEADILQGEQVYRMVGTTQALHEALREKGMATHKVFARVAVGELLEGLSCIRERS